MIKLTVHTATKTAIVVAFPSGQLSICVYKPSLEVIYQFAVKL